MLNVEQTIISQYGSAATISQLVQSMNDYIDPRANLDAFYSMVFDLNTAQGFGLDFWGKVVNVSRQLSVPASDMYFGFNEGSDYAPFGQAPFYSGTTATSVYSLADDAYRTLILVKALANISDCTAPSLNRLLQNLFASRGRCYVADDGQMQMRYVFEFPLMAYEVAILTQSNAIPRPAAVSTTITEIAYTDLLGFNEAGDYQTFGNGTLFKRR